MSEALTGAPFRLEIALVVSRLPGTTFSPKDVQALLAPDVGQPVADRNLKKLVEAGVLDHVAHGLYSRRPSPLWTFVQDLEDQLLRPSASYERDDLRLF